MVLVSVAFYSDARVKACAGVFLSDFMPVPSNRPRLGQHDRSRVLT